MTINAKAGYLNIKLSEKSSYLTTFKTAFGRYKWNCLSFGLVSNTDVLHES